MTAPRPTVRSRLSGKLAGAALPLRRTISRVALVYEERYFRDEAVNGVYAALAAQGTKLGGTIRGLEERVIRRVDILMEELWRRTESVGARQATELQRLAARVQDVQRAAESRAPELEQLARQMAEVHRLAGEVAEIRLLSMSMSADAARVGPATRGPLLAELERGIRPPARERWEPHLKHLHGLAPVAALGCGNGDFLTLALEAGVQAYTVDSDADAVARATAAGFDARVASPLEHLQALPASSLGGAFLSLVTHPASDEQLAALLAGLARALHRDGVAVIESANPASFASFLHSTCQPGTAGQAGGANGPPATLPPDVFADRAQLAGLDVEECRYSPLPARHLAGVSGDLADPALREIAVGVNDLVGQLNDVLYGPQDYILILRKP